MPLPQPPPPPPLLLLLLLPLLLLRTSKRISMTGSWKMKLEMPATTPRLAYFGPSSARSSGVPRITAVEGGGR